MSDYRGPMDCSWVVKVREPVAGPHASHGPGCILQSRRCRNKPLVRRRVRSCLMTVSGWFVRVEPETLHSTAILGSNHHQAADVAHGDLAARWPWHAVLFGYKGTNDLEIVITQLSMQHMNFIDSPYKFH